MVKLTKLPHGPLVARALKRIGGTGMNKATDAREALIDQIMDERQKRAETVYDLNFKARELLRKQLKPDSPTWLREAFDTLHMVHHVLGGDPFDMHMRAALASAPVAVKTPISKRIAMARGHLMNIEAYGNAEANGVLVIRNVLSEVEAALSAIEPQEGWRDMSSAPKDGTRILTVRRAGDSLHEADIVRWDAEEEEWWSDAADQFGFPDLWMPLPTPPAGRAEG